jgi:hypothetical protein
VQRDRRCTGSIAPEEDQLAFVDSESTPASQSQELKGKRVDSTTSEAHHPSPDLRAREALLNRLAQRMW